MIITSKEPIDIYIACKKGIHCECFYKTGTCCHCCATDESTLKREYLSYLDTILKRGLHKYPNEVKEIIQKYHGVD